MIVVDKEQRPTIEQVLQNPYFDEVRDMEEFPSDLPEFMIQLRSISDDLIARDNVHALDSKEDFQSKLDSRIKELILEED